MSAQTRQVLGDPLVGPSHHHHHLHRSSVNDSDQIHLHSNTTDTSTKSIQKMILPQYTPTITTSNHINGDTGQNAGKEIPKGRKRKNQAEHYDNTAKAQKDTTTTRRPGRPPSRKRQKQQQQQQQQQEAQTAKSPPPRRATSPSVYDPSQKHDRNIEKIVYGNYEINTWYHSPYPRDYGQLLEKLYVCERCLLYMNSETYLHAHQSICKVQTPPGHVIYQEGNTKIYEVDGNNAKLYCQNLCLMSKLFLDTKTLYYDVSGFMFYVLTEHIDGVDVFIGYFSKEKISYDNYNLACIMVLPSHQRKGYGRLLIELSYELSKREGKIGSPEKPLSALGALGYLSYWSSVLLKELSNFRGELTINALSARTGIHKDDMISTLHHLGLLRFWKKDLLPPTPEAAERYGVKGRVQVCMSADMIAQAIEKHRVKLDNRLDQTCLIS